MSRPLPFANSLVERIKINAVWREKREGRVFWIKRRRWFAAPLLAGANVFFRKAGAPLRVLPDAEEWQRWEVESYRALHAAEGFQAAAEGACVIALQELPGISLTAPLDAGALTPGMTAAAARELRRAHESGWSHGDPHLGNFAYDAAADRARIMDFEVRHEPSLPAAQRYADDLLVCLQDMLGRIAEEHWLPCARSFLEAYARPEIVALLRPQLALPPRGAARMWWRIRTSFLSTAEIERRLTALHEKSLVAR